MIKNSRKNEVTVHSLYEHVICTRILRRITTSYIEIPIKDKKAEVKMTIEVGKVKQQLRLNSIQNRRHKESRLATEI